MEQRGYPLGEWNFPHPQYMVPPPAPYIPPGAFYGQHLAVAGTPSSPSPPSPSTRKRKPPTERSTSPPAKRRGRPPGSGTKKPAAGQRKAATKAPKAKAAPKKRKTVNQNIPIELSDSDSDIEQTLDGHVKHWTKAERTLYFQFALGHDEEGNKRFEQHKKNPGHVYKRASDLVFNGSRSAASIKSMWTRSMDTFTWIIAFESFTGNGGGDADTDDATAVLNRMSAARRAGLQLGSLKRATIDEWYNEGWYDLFNDRLGTSAKVSRDVVRNSASALSDPEDVSNPVDDENDDGADSDANINPILRTQPAPPKTPAATVSEPKHTPVSAFRKQTGNSFGHISEFMKVKMLSEEKKATALESKLQLEREKLELDKAKVKVEMARNVFQMDGASEQVKEAANAYLLSLFV